MGKSSTLDHLGDLLAESATPFALMDVDWFHRCWPPAADDPDNLLTEAENLAAVWSAYRRTSPRQLVVSGVMVSPHDRERYERTFGMPVRSVRLEATPEVTEARLRRRHGQDRVRSLDWHLGRHVELATRLARADGDELCIRTDDLSPREVARRVLVHFGLGR